MNKLQEGPGNKIISRKKNTLNYLSSGSLTLDFMRSNQQDKPEGNGKRCQVKNRLQFLPFHSPSLSTFSTHKNFNPANTRSEIPVSTDKITIKTNVQFVINLILEIVLSHFNKHGTFLTPDKIRSKGFLFPFYLNNNFN